MKCVGAGFAMAMLLLGSTACLGDDGKTGGEKANKGKGAQGTGQAPAGAVPLPGKVELPEQPAELGDVISRQVQAARWVRVSVTYTETGAEGGGAGGGDGVARLDAQMRLGPGPTEALLTAVDTEKGKRSTTHAIMTGGLYFTRVEGEEQVKGKPWLRLSYTELNNGQLGPFATIFTGVLSKLESEIKKLSVDTGTTLVRNGSLKGDPAQETAGGATVHRFKGTTDTADMTKVDTDYAKMSQRGFKTIPWTIWLADNGLPQRFNATIGRGDATVDSVATYSRWGQPVSIKPPPAAQVATVADMTKG